MPAKGEEGTGAQPAEGKAKGRADEDAEALPEGVRVQGRMTGPVEVPPGMLEFFTDPAFSKEENDGRLYYDIATGLRGRYEPWSVAFVVWRPAGDAEDRKQRLDAAKGYYITPGDIATDGKVLLVTQRPVGKGKDRRLRVERWVWKGDRLGNGEWAPRGLVKMLPAD